MGDSMSIVLQGSTSGSITLQEPAVAGSTVLDLPAVSGTILTTTSPKAGNVIQVVSTTKTDAFSSTTASAWTDITGMSASITPTSSSSKILIMVQLYGSSRYNGYGRLVRGTTPIFIGDAAGSRPQASVGSFYNYADNNIVTTQPIIGLDSPSTTSSTTYKVQFWILNGTFTCNRSINDSNDADTGRGYSSITLMEIAG